MVKLALALIERGKKNPVVRFLQRDQGRISWPASVGSQPSAAVCLLRPLRRWRTVLTPSVSRRREEEWRRLSAPAASSLLGPCSSYAPQTPAGAQWPRQSQRTGGSCSAILGLECQPSRLSSESLLTRKLSPSLPSIVPCRFASRLGVSPADLASRTGWDARSGGLTDEYEPHGSPASGNGVVAMRRLGLDLSHHRSRVLTREDLERAPYIFCVSKRHKEWISRIGGSEAAARTKTLGEDIPDPWHQEQAVYDACADHMAKIVPSLMEAEFGSSISPSRKVS